MPKTDEVLLARAKAMRSNPTPAEARLWYNLRAKRFEGFKFLHQVVIAPYIADFVARSRKLIVEVDGDTHDDEAKDARRTAYLERRGYRVIRFGNSDVMNNIEGVLMVILQTLEPAPLPSAAFGGSLPLPGGEREKRS